MFDFFQSQKMHLFDQESHQNKDSDGQHCLHGNNKIRIYHCLFYKWPGKTGEGSKIIINGFGPADELDTAILP